MMKIAIKLNFRIMLATEAPKSVKIKKDRTYRIAEFSKNFNPYSNC